MIAAPLEREAELAVLEKLLHGLTVGESGVIVISGVAGIGKTTLVKHVTRQADDGEVTVLSARGTPLGREVPFGVVRQLFDRVVAASPDDLLSGAAALARPALLADADVDGASVDLDSVLHGLFWLAVNLSERGALLVCVDDVQWCDDGSLRWLVHLAERAAGLPIAVVVSLRTGEPDTLLALVDELVAVPGARLLEPAPLSADAVRTLVSDAHDGVADAEFAAACTEATGGVPFYTCELIAATVAEGVAPTRGEAAKVRSLTSATISSALLARLGRLPSSSHEIATALAAFGGTAELGALAAVVELPEPEVVDGIETLVAAGLLAAGLPLTFAHPLIETAVAAQISAARREVLDRRCIEVLRERRVGVERIAAHLMRIEPAGDGRAADDLLAAARAALARGASGAAAAFFDRALSEPVPAAERAEATFEAASAHVTLGSSRALELSRLALSDEGDEERAGEATLLLAQALTNAGWIAEAREVVSDALGATSLDGGARLRLQGRAIFLAVLSMEPESGRHLLDAVRHLEGVDAIECEALAAGAWLAMDLGEPREVVLPMALRAGRGVAHDAWRATTTIHCLRACEEFAVVDTLAADAEQAALDRGAESDWMTLIGAHSSALLQKGDVTIAEELCRLGWVVAERLGPEAFGWSFMFDSHMAMLYLVSDANTTAAVLARDARPERLGRGWAAWNAGKGRGFGLLCLGRPGDALVEFDSVEGFPGSDAGPVPWHDGIVSALVATGELGRARELAEVDVAASRAFGGLGFLAAALRVLATTLPDDDAIDVLREALDLADRSTMTRYQAECRLALGSALRRRNHRAEARPLLAEALDIGVRSGMRRLADSAEEELRATGARPRRTVLSGIDSLTASERRVCRLVAEGRTNREAAQALFVTPKTIERHLYSAFGKLDIGSRADLKEALVPSPPPTAA